MAIHITPEAGVPITDIPLPDDLADKARAASKTAHFLHQQGLEVEVTEEVAGGFNTKLPGVKQVVELIENEVVIANDPVVKTALNDIIKKIEVLEDIEMDSMYRDFVENEKTELERKSEIRKKAEQEFQRAFKS